MSKIVEIQELLETLIASTLPEYQMLSDAYDAGDNTNIRLEKGFSTGFGAATNNNDNFCHGTTRVKRQIVVALTNVYVADLDPQRRQDLEQSLMNDHAALLAALECEPTLSGSCVNSNYVGDQGIEYLSNDRKQFIVIFTNLEMDYIERV